MKNAQRLSLALPFTAQAMAFVAIGFGLAPVDAQARAAGWQPAPWTEPRTDNDSRTPQQRLIEAAQQCRWILDQNLEDKDEENRQYEDCIDKQCGNNC